MSKLFFFLLVICIIAIVFIVKRNNDKSIMENSATTKGQITKVFQRGKLPYCSFTYSVNNITYNKQQSVPKNLKNKIKGNFYTVYYHVKNPQKSILRFSED